MNNKLKFLFLIISTLLSLSAYSHGVDESTELFLINNEGLALFPYMYIGAKHMVTGYDHLLFLVGVIFLLFKFKDIIIYVSFFTIGHSITLLVGTYYNILLNPYLIDAIIALSIVYKGFDNIGGFQKLVGKQPNTKLAVLIFGLFHGFGLATKIQDFDLKSEGLLANLISFNIGVELGQFFALLIILTLLSYWRRFSSYLKFSTLTNTLLMSAGMALFLFQITAYFYYK